jgi:two-component system sensor histidine kinase BaeS
MRSLRARVTIVTVLVSVVAVAVTGLITLQLVRGSTVDEARDQLAAQADILATLPRLASAAELAEKASLALGGTEVALVRDGTATGGAAAYVSAAIRAKLEAGENVSTTRRGDLGLVMIEARQTDDGAIVLALPLASVDRAVSKVTTRTLIALGIGLITAVVGATLLARRLSRPLVDTAAAARRLASGERGVQVPSTTTTEIADVTTALSSLDAALATSEGRQREFLLSISHELRTPITAVRGYAEALADGIVEDPASVGRTLVSETERLDSFVRDLLELARLEADDFSITLAPVNLAALVSETVAAWAGRSATLGADIRARGSGTATTDARRLRQVLDGLVENALRAGATVISVDVSPGTVAVADNGPGFSEDDLEVAFERGALHARYRDLRPVGTGLGLSIAARIVGRLHGTLTVSNAPGGGAVFTIALG